MLSSSAKILKISLTFDKVTESLKVGTFFETQCRSSELFIIKNTCFWDVDKYSFTGVQTHLHPHFDLFSCSLTSFQLPVSPAEMHVHLKVHFFQVKNDDILDFW